MGQHTHLYDRRWRKARAAFLREHPLCQCPLCDEGRKRVMAAEVVHHLKPHNGDLALFWDQDNWSAWSKPCHDSIAQQLEKSGHIKGWDAKGVPLDPNHHWNKPERAA